MECCIAKINDLNSGYRSRNFNVGIRRWIDKEDATDLRALIVDIFLELTRKLEMLEMNNPAFVMKAQKDKGNKTTTELES